MELSYAELALIEDALLRYLGNEVDDWINPHDEQVSLSREDIGLLFKKVHDQRGLESWAENVLSWRLL
jgi:hypothetical protein